VGSDQFLWEMRGGGERSRIAEARAVHETTAVHIDTDRFAGLRVDGYVRREGLELGWIARGAFDGLKRAPREANHAEIVVPREFQRAAAGFLIVMVIIRVRLIGIGLG